MLNIIVLLSGSGSNLQAIIDSKVANIQAVISNKANAYGLERAKKADIKTHIVEHQNISREEFDEKLKTTIELYQPDLIVLAGFMRILSAEFINAFKNKIINIHPSLLPKFKGLNTHQRAIDAGEKEHGATVHLVSSKLDSGKILAQAKVTIAPNDTAETLAKKVLQQEHIIYSKTIKTL
jgi:phosphoribosylglycinamide formyltransferase-1